MRLDHEALIIGGGPAGLSAALTLGRINRNALVCDDGNPRNAPSAHVNNFPSADGIHPAEWRKQARRDLEKYPSIHFFTGKVLSVQKGKDHFTAHLSDGRQVIVKKVILAYGVQDRLLPIPGFNELWGKAIFHCPFCHGYEVRGTELGLIMKNEMAFHSMPLIASLAKKLTLLTDGPLSFTPEQTAVLKKFNVSVVQEKITSLLHEGEKLTAVALENGEKLSPDYLFYAAAFPFQLKSDIGTSLGCAKNQFGLYQVNEFGATSVAGVFACGDNMQAAQSVLLSCSTGAKAGFAVIAELLNGG